MSARPPRRLSPDFSGPPEEAPLGSGSFRRAASIVAAAHVALLLVLWGLEKWSHRPQEEILWFDGGLAGGPPASEEAAPEPAPEPPPPVEPPEPATGTDARATAPAGTRGAERAGDPRGHAHSDANPNSDSKAYPDAGSHTQAHPQSDPKPTPKSSPKATPKPSPKPSSSPKATPKATPKKGDGPPGEKPAASPSKKSASTSGKAGAGASSGPGPGTGKSGAGKGSGPAASENQAYFGRIATRYTDAWVQPVSIIRSGVTPVTTLKVRIARSGAVLHYEISNPSGNPVMDESVLEVAAKITQLEPLPAGLGGETFEFPINFKLNQDQ